MTVGLQSAGDDAQASAGQPVIARGRRRTVKIVAAVLTTLAAAGIAFGVYRLLQPPVPVFVYAVAFDGRTPFAVVDAGGTVRLENVSTGQLTAPLAALNDDNDNDGELGIDGVRFSSDGKLVALRHDDGIDEPSTGVWDTATGHRVAAIPGVGTLAFSHDDKTLAISTDGTDGTDGNTDLWSIATRHRIATLTEPSNEHDLSSVTAVAFSPDDRTLGVVVEDPDMNYLAGFTRLWDIATRHISATLPSDEGELAFSPDGSTVATSDFEGPNAGVNVWSLATHKQIAHFASEMTAQALAFSPDGTTIVTGGGDTIITSREDNGFAVLWNAATHQAIAALPRMAPPFNSVPPFGVYVSAVAFSPDGRTVAVGDLKGHVHLWNVSAFSPRRRTG